VFLDNRLIQAGMDKSADGNATQLPAELTGEQLPTWTSFCAAKAVRKKKDEIFAVVKSSNAGGGSKCSE
jgi:hypothetical protein